MDNQHKMIKGYRDLSAEEIALMNEIKGQAEVTRNLILKVNEHLSKSCTYVKDKDSTFHSVATGSIISHSQGFDENTERWLAARPYDWLERAQDDLQDGFMKLTRSVAQPTSF